MSFHNFIDLFILFYYFILFNYFIYFIFPLHALEFNTNALLEEMRGNSINIKIFINIIHYV